MQIIYKEKLLELYEAIGQRFFELIVSLLAMIIVARSFNLAEFGLFSYLVALFHLATFISEAGICDRFRNRFSLKAEGLQDLQNARGALFLTGILTGLFFLVVAGYELSQEVFDKQLLAYLFLAVIVPLSNGNRLRTTLLHVSGKHSDASRLLLKKQGVFLACIFVISFIELPSLLLGSFLIAEIYQRRKIRKKVKMGKLFQASFFVKGLQTIPRSLRHLFSGEALNLIFHTDLFILGLFVTSSQLGVYAEAALLGRFFLLIPVGVRPILHRYLAGIAGVGAAGLFSRKVHFIRAYMFFFHTILAMFLTLFFDDILHAILALYGSEKLSHDLFIIMLPGFLFYSAAIVNESALEASGNAPFLSRVSIFVICLNVLLNFYFVPFAGARGAAIASLVCLLLYFFTICVVKITRYCRTPFFEFLTVGASTYLLIKLIEWMDLSLFVFMIVVPPILYLVFYLLKFFDFDDYHVPLQSNLHS